MSESGCSVIVSSTQRIYKHVKKGTKTYFYIVQTFTPESEIYAHSFLWSGLELKRSAFNGYTNSGCPDVPLNQRIKVSASTYAAVAENKSSGFLLNQFWSEFHMLPTWALTIQKEF